MPRWFGSGEGALKVVAQSQVGIDKPQRGDASKIQKYPVTTPDAG